MAETPDGTGAIELEGKNGEPIVQTTTRGNFWVRPGQTIRLSDVDFGPVASQVQTHFNGAVTGGEFNTEEFNSPGAVIDTVVGSLPDNLRLDQYGRAELTIDYGQRVVGYDNVYSLHLVDDWPATGRFRHRRDSTGQPGMCRGIFGAWYPERATNPTTNQSEVILDQRGQPSNPKFYFEPEAHIALVSDFDFFKALIETGKITAILQQNPDGLQAQTILPGNNHPAFPQFCQSLGLNTLDSYAAEYWEHHAYVRHSPAR